MPAPSANFAAASRLSRAFRFALPCVSLLTVATAAQGQTSNFSANFDRWMYPFGATPGTEPAASSFAAIGSDGFDDRDAQFLVGFGTGASVTPGLGAGNYDVASARVAVTIVTPDTFAYDPSEDSVTSYAPGGTDADTGRPIELHGVGYRGGFTESTFGESTAFGLMGPPAEAVRRAFAADVNGATATDVSNNVTGPDLDDSAANDAFDANPWATGTAAALAPGATVPANTVFTFDLDLADPDVLAYVQRGLDAGSIRFAISSLHPASFGGAPSYPRYYTRENDPARAATLEVTLVPEPATTGVACAAAVGLLMPRRRRGLRN